MVACDVFYYALSDETVLGGDPHRDPSHRASSMLRVAKKERRSKRRTNLPRSSRRPRVVGACPVPSVRSTLARRASWLADPKKACVGFGRRSERPSFVRTRVRRARMASSLRSRARGRRASRRWTRRRHSRAAVASRRWFSFVFHHSGTTARRSKNVSSSSTTTPTARQARMKSSGTGARIGRASRSRRKRWA